MEAKFKRDNHFEERLIQAMLSDYNFAEQMIDVLDVNYFNLEHLRETAKLIFKYYNKYSAFPSIKLLASIVKQEVEGELLQKQIREYLALIYKTPMNGDMEYIKEESLDFCRKRSLALALEKSLDYIVEKKYESIVDEVQKALLAGSEKDVGHNLHTDLEKRIQKIENNPISTGWEQIDNITRGGPGPGKLCSFLASTGVGKSHCLVNIGANMARNGKNIVHYTLELLAEEVAIRYDANISDINVDEIGEHKEEVQKKLDDIPGKVIIKSFPMYGVSSLTIKNHVRQLKIRNIDVDCVIIDYADIMRSRQKYDQLRLEQQHIYGELKSLAVELNVPIYTCTQSNRSGFSDEILKADKVGESWGKVQIADLFITMSRKLDRTETTTGYFYVAKNRLGVDGIAFPIRVKTGKSQIEVLEMKSEEIEEQEFDKEALRKKYAEIEKKLRQKENKE